MARKMQLPKIGVNMTEATITKWLIKEGDTIAEGDAILEAETDKSTQEIYATDGGIVAKLLAAEGTTVECYKDILVLVDEGEEYKEEEPAAPAVAETAEAPAAPAAPAAPVAVPVAAPAMQSGARVKISPLAKKIAKEKGIDYKLITPSVPGGRIVKKDVEAFIANGGAAACAAVGENLEVIPMSNMRKVIARRMSESAFTKPTVPLTASVDVTKLLAIRKLYKEKDVKISMDALVAKAAAMALLKHRNINATLEGENICIKKDINIGVAVDAPKGLMVPVVKNADTMRLADISAGIIEMAQDAKEGRLSGDKMSGGTFTITNLGMFGVEQFAPIINDPECCILSLGTVKKQFVPDENDQPKVANIMKITLVFDHRIVDGAPAARFLKDLVEYLETPALML